jgi:hypothetical protein
MLKPNQHIYITSDEEIKEGDWIINNANNFISFASGEDKDLNNFENVKKIILTTDQYLIKDGVQAIDDEFLEWFVKNPSCEYVEVEKILLGKVEGTTMTISKYKIIIPKEEPKQTDEKGNPLTYWGGLEEPKQETLEEAAELALVFHNTYEKLAPSFGYETRQDTKEFDFKSNNGRLMVAVCSEIIKWQQEQDKNKYSEEDIKEAFYQGWVLSGARVSFKEAISKWFKQFKKNKI